MLFGLFQQKRVEETPIGISQQTIVESVQANDMGRPDHSQYRKHRERWKDSLAPTNAEMLFEHFHIFDDGTVAGMTVNAGGAHEFAGKEK